MWIRMLFLLYKFFDLGNNQWTEKKRTLSWMHIVCNMFGDFSADIIGFESDFRGKLWASLKRWSVQGHWAKYSSICLWPNEGHWFVFIIFQAFSGKTVLFGISQLSKFWSIHCLLFGFIEILMVGRQKQSVSFPRRIYFALKTERAHVDWATFFRLVGIWLSLWLDDITSSETNWPIAFDRK